MIFAEVPAKKVLGCPVTGYGSMPESEWVILGGKENMFMSKIIPTEITKFMGVEIQNMSFDSWEDLFSVSKGLSMKEKSLSLKKNIFKAISEASK